MTLASFPIDYTALKNDTLNIVYFNEIKYTQKSLGDFQSNFKLAFLEVILKIPAHTVHFCLWPRNLSKRFVSYSFLLSTHESRLSKCLELVRLYNVLPNKM